MAGKNITANTTGDIKIYGRLVNATTTAVIANAAQIEASSVKVGENNYDNQDDINQALANALSHAGSGSGDTSSLLDDSGKIKSDLLPSYVDDVVDVASVDTEANTVTIGTLEQQPTAGKLYVDPSGNVYRYTGSKLAQVTSADTVNLAQRVKALEDDVEFYEYDSSKDDGLYLRRYKGTGSDGDVEVITQYNSDDFDFDGNLAKNQVSQNPAFIISIKAIDVNKITDPNTDTNSLFYGLDV